MRIKIKKVARKPKEKYVIVDKGDGSFVSSRKLTRMIADGTMTYLSPDFDSDFVKAFVFKKEQDAKDIRDLMHSELRRVFNQRSISYVVLKVI